MTINKSIAEYRQEQINPSWRKEIFKIKSKKCHICGDTEFLEIHHLIALKNGGTNDINNLLVLCQKCHKLVHNKIHKNTSKNGRPKVIEFEDAEKHLKRYFNLEIGKQECIKLLGINPKSKTVWERLTKEYKEKYNINRFKNTIDVKNSKTKYLQSLKKFDGQII